MTSSLSRLGAVALAASIAAGSLATSGAVAQTVIVPASPAKVLVVCNRYNECWRVHQRYTFYPADEGVVFRDDAWWVKHEHDKVWRELPDPSDEHGWYDIDGNWHPFTKSPGG